MKNLIFIPVIFLLFINYANSQITMNSQGNVAIGTTSASTEKFYVNGSSKLNGLTTMGCAPASGNLIFTNSGEDAVLRPDYHSTAFLGLSNKQFYKIYSQFIYMNGALVQTSDEKIKENIKPLTNALSQIKKVKSYKYDIKKEHYKDAPENKKDKLRRKDNIGFLAQELQEIYPELVIKDEDSGLLGINYVGMVPVLVEAMKEQQYEIESLKKEIESLKTDCCEPKLKSSQKNETTSVKNEDINSCSLQQNEPNPFRESTTIKYYLPKQTLSAMISIYDMNGTQLKQIEITQTGNGSIMIHGGELKAGMYLYALIANGQLIDTKQMILTN